MIESLDSFCKRTDITMRELVKMHKEGMVNIGAINREEGTIDTSLAFRHLFKLPLSFEDRRNVTKKFKEAGETPLSKLAELGLLPETKETSFYLPLTVKALSILNMAYSELPLKDSDLDIVSKARTLFHMLTSGILRKIGPEKESPGE